MWGLLVARRRGDARAGWRSPSALVLPLPQSWSHLLLSADAHSSCPHATAPPRHTWPMAGRSAPYSCAPKDECSESGSRQRRLFADRVQAQRCSREPTLRRQLGCSSRLQLSAAALGPSPCAQPSDEPSSLMSKSTEQVLRILRRLLALQRRQRLGSAAHAPSLHVARRERGAHEASRQVFPWRHGCRGCHTPGPISVAGGGAE